MENGKKKVKNKHPDWKTTRIERFWYFLGDFGRYGIGNLVVGLMSLFLVFRGLNPIWIAGVMLAVKIVDAVDDVIFGFVVDRTNPKNWKITKKIAKDGKYLPWYRVTFWLFPLFTSVVFLMPADWSAVGKLIWFAVFYIFYDLSYTLIEVPMSSMIITLTDNLEERNRIIMVKFTIVAFSAITLGVLWVFLVSENVGMDIPTIVFMFTTIFLVFMIPLAIKGKEHNTRLDQIQQEQEERYTFKDMLKAIKVNKYLQIYLLSSVITACLQTGGSIGLFASYYLFGDTMILVYPIAIAFIPQLILQIFSPKIVKKMGARKVITIFGLIGVVFFSTMYFVGYNYVWLCMGLLVAQAFPNMLKDMALQYLMPGTVEYARYKTGKDSSGIAFAITSFFNKTTTSIASSLGLFLLGLSGWVEVVANNFADLEAAAVEQPPSVYPVLWFLYVGLPVLGHLLGVLIIFFYKLKDKDVELMAKFNGGEITREECEAQLSRKY